MRRLLQAGSEPRVNSILSCKILQLWDFPDALASSYQRSKWQMHRIDVVGYDATAVTEVLVWQRSEAHDTVALFITYLEPLSKHGPLNFTLHDPSTNGCVTAVWKYSVTI